MLLQFVIDVPLVFLNVFQFVSEFTKFTKKRPPFGAACSQRCFHVSEDGLICRSIITFSDTSTAPCSSWACTATRLDSARTRFAENLHGLLGSLSLCIAAVRCLPRRVPAGFCPLAHLPAQRKRGEVHLLARAVDVARLSSSGLPLRALRSFRVCRVRVVHIWRRRWLRRWLRIASALPRLLLLLVMP